MVDIMSSFKRPQVSVLQTAYLFFLALNANFTHLL